MGQDPPRIHSANTTVCNFPLGIYCYTQAVSITLSILFRSWRMIDLIDLCQQSDMAILTSCNFVGGAGKETGDCILCGTSTCPKRKWCQRCWYSHWWDCMGLEPTQVSNERFPTTVFTANPLLNTQLYNYNLLQLCKEVTFQKGLLISHS